MLARRPLHVCVIGAGLMGAQIGLEHALGGHRVAMVVRRPGRAEERIGQALEAARLSGLYGADEATRAAGSLEIVSSTEELDGEPDLVVESIAEDMAQKVEVLGATAVLFPTAVLATNTSSLGISLLGESIGASGRTLGTHYWNPPLLMPLVELVPGRGTGAEVVDAVEAVLRELGKHPVRVGDVPGFAGNRLQYALLREAAWLVENDVASPESVDAIVRTCLGRRWRLTGPFETVALGGTETFERVAANLFPVLSRATELEGLGRWVPGDADTLQASIARRDEELAREVRRDADGRGAGA